MTNTMTVTETALLSLLYLLPLLSALAVGAFLADYFERRNRK